MKIVAQNKKATHDYFIETRYEAGIQLLGSEVKSIRATKVNLNDAHVNIRNNEVYLLNMHISKYDFGNRFNHDELRTRKLLLNKKEILKLQSKIKEDGYTIIPLKVYLKDGLIKIEIALAKGKKNYDKRESLKEKDMQMRMKKQFKMN
ncbi:SsrA-binding protein [Alteracholeplasma palmae J233]|uniref:SsrA-binding protein n=1 Tax=Alteracholeplasma palmae (strain ATCC 49389 / J233) TaxID=1318466 RepID=U4KLA4_ALTPJ|nr:SsrA-binding protein SmpB [Alteracholeplasma palmae]CCV64577.1 SsrA-binding protein [Alteracholeplasma palmae J233]